MFVSLFIIYLKTLSVAHAKCFSHSFFSICSAKVTGDFSRPKKQRTGLLFLIGLSHNSDISFLGCDAVWFVTYINYMTLH